MSSPSATLVALPRELIDTIVGYLSPSEIICFRSVCRTFDAASFTVFADAYFSIIQYDFSHYDTEYLKLFAVEKRLAVHVKTLRICNTSCPRIIPGTKSYLSGKALGQGYEWERESYGSVTDQNSHIADVGKLLRDRFTNCRNFCVTNEDVRGIRSIFSSRWLTPDDAINILLHVILQQNLKVNCFEIDYSGDVSIQEVDPARLLFSTQRWTCEGLPIQSLSLHTGLGVGSDWIALFIGSTQSLRSLHLQLDGMSDEVDRFFCKISRATGPLEIRRLSLQMISIRSYEALKSLFQRLGKTLISLRLRSIRLQDGQWQLLLRSIAASCRVLSDISIEFGLSEQEPYPIRFSSMIDVAELYGVQNPDVDGKAGWKNSSACIRYAGPHVADAIMGLLQKMETDVLPKPSH